MANPYEAPGQSISPMTLDRRLGSRLLETREKGHSLGLYYRWQAMPYSFLFLMFGIAIAYFAWYFQPSGLLIGALIGILLRDFGLARTQGKLWQAHSKLLDRDKVERMAEGDALD